MTIFLSITITAVICIYFLKLSPIINRTNFYKDYKFNNFRNESDLKDTINKSDLISFRHEFGETIFEIQKEIESLRAELNNLKREISNNKK